MTPLTDQELSDIEARAEKATPGPWTADPPDEIELQIDPGTTECWGIRCPAGSVVVTDSGCYPPDMPTAQFIAAAREDVPRLVAEVRRLSKVVREASEHVTEARLARKQVEAELATAQGELGPLRRELESTKGLFQGAVEYSSEEVARLRAALASAQADLAAQQRANATAGQAVASWQRQAELAEKQAERLGAFIERHSLDLSRKGHRICLSCRNFIELGESHRSDCELVALLGREPGR